MVEVRKRHRNYLSVRGFIGAPKASASPLVTDLHKGSNWVGAQTMTEEAPRHWPGQEEEGVVRYRLRSCSY